MERARHRLACLAIAAAAIAAFTLLRAPFLSLPLERDEGEYAYIAQRIAAGDVPYRDAFDQKPPGVFLAYRAAFALFGESIEAIHAFLHLWTAATALVLFLFVRREAGSLAGCFAVLVFSIASADPQIAATAANTEAFMLLPLVGSVYCLARALAAGGALWWLACGVLAAAACWFKQVAALNGLLVLGAALAHARAASPPQWSAAFGHLGLVALGAALASLPVLWYFAAADALRPFLDAVFLHNLQYSQTVPMRLGLEILWLRVLQQLPSMAVFWGLAGIALCAPTLVGWKRWSLLAGFAFTSAAGVAVGFYFRPHYFLQLAPALASLCGVTLAAAAGRLIRQGGGTAVAGIAAMIAVLVAPPVWANRDVLFAESSEESARRIYGLNPFPEAIEIARHIRRNSAPEDEIYVIGSEPEIFFYAGRRSASRYIFFYPLTGRYPDAVERQREVVTRVGKRRPLYVVWVNVGTSLAVEEDTEKFIFQSGAKWLRRHYRIEFFARPAGDFEGFDFVYGKEAAELLASLDGKMAENPWVAVFRRAR